MPEHVRLLDPIATLAPVCPHCLQVDDERIGRMLDSIAVYDPAFRSLQETMHRLQRGLRAMIAEQRRIVAELASLNNSHPRCALCRAAIGPGHASEQLYRERFGAELVCSDCLRTLTSAKLSAVDQLKAWWQEDRDESNENQRNSSLTT